MPALGTIVTTTTQTRLLPKAIDNVLSGNVLSMLLMNDARTWTGGTSIDIPVFLSNITTVGSYSGFDTFSTTQENTRQRAVFNPSQLYVSIPVSGIQKAVNQGDAAVLNLVATEMEFRTNRLRDEFGTQIYTDGTGNSSKDILGLQAAVDDSTNVTTYAGLSRSTYTNWRATLTAQSGSLSLANLAADFDAAQIGTDSPDLFVTTPAVFTIYEALLTPTVQHNLSFGGYDMLTPGGPVKGGVAAGQGFRSLYFRGVPFVADEKATSGNIYTLNRKHLFFYTIPDGEREVKNGFKWTGWKEPANQDATVGELLWYGQLICDSPRTQARRTGVTS